MKNEESKMSADRRVPFCILHVAFRITTPIALALMILVLSACQQAPPPSPNYREYAFVTSESGVSVVDLRTFHIAATISTGRGANGIAINPKNNEIYVVNSDSNNVSFIDAEKLAVVATIGVHRSPQFIDVSDDGKRAYVANNGSANVSVLDLTQRKVAANIGVGSSPWMARVSKDGKTVVVSNTADGTVSLVDPEKFTVRATVQVCKSPRDLAILPDSSKAFVICPEANQVAAVDLDVKSPKLLALLDVGKQPENLIVKPDGGELFVSNRDANSVSIIETTTNEVGNTFQVGAAPTGMTATLDNSTLFIASSGSDSVAVYAIDNGRVICPTGSNRENTRRFCELPTGREPRVIALSPNENFLLVVDGKDGDVAVIRTEKLPEGSKISADRALFTIIPVGVNPKQIAVKAFVANQKR